MKKIILFSIILFLLFTNVFSQLKLAKDSQGDYITNVLFNNINSGGKSDTAFSSTFIIPADINLLIAQLNVDSVSVADSLWIQFWHSPDNITWFQITNPAFTTITAVSKQTINLTNVSRYLRARYFVMGTASKFHFKLNLIPKK